MPNVGISVGGNFWSVGSANYSVYSQSLTSDASGNYSVALLVNNSYSASLTPVAGSGYVATSISPLDVSTTVVKNLLLNPAFTLSGTVKSTSGVAISNIKVCSSSGPTSKCSTSDASGLYSLTGLDSGTYSLGISRSGTTNIATPASFSISSVITNLAITANTNQDITVPVVTLSGKTTDNNGVAVPNVGISVGGNFWSVGSANYSVYSQSLTSDASGNYSVALLANNSYSITITPPTGSLFVPANLTGYDMTVSKIQNIILSKTVSQYQLFVTVTGTGSGSVSASPVGFTCSNGKCGWYYDSGTTVNLGATPNAGSTFAGWSGGGCSGTAGCTVNSGATVTATFTATTSVIAADLVAGWNLLGNGSDGTVDVATAFGDATKISTVWKWVSGANPGWAFYTPLQVDGGAAYAASKGYNFLTTIKAGEGFWVNAKQAVTMPVATGHLLPTVAFRDGTGTADANALPQGWSLIAVGDNPTPRNFVNGILSPLGTPPTAGAPAASTLTTLWSWNAGNVTTSPGWFFYSPALDNNGGLANYVTSKGYLDFGAMSKTLDAAVGFWVNHP
ncbi:Cna protein B-type domain protein [mine drainage metagenome]|uniref:Cna protein B-type domain protein n=1 Tax=mine drainage metagenome TaxID=410659 RepID=A0A1J5PKS1_9ZZZZ